MARIGGGLWHHHFSLPNSSPGAGPVNLPMPKSSGCYALPISDEQQAILADKARTAIVSDKAAVPDRFWVTPARRIDLDALAAALLVGERIEGAELSPEKKTLSVRSRQRRRAK